MGRGGNNLEKSKNEELRESEQVTLWEILKGLKVLEKLIALESLKAFCKVRKSKPFVRLIYKGELSGSYPVQNSKKNIHHWISTSPLDMGNKMPPGAINDSSRASKPQWQL